MLTKQQVLDGVKTYFVGIAQRDGYTGSGWRSCALGSLLQGNTQAYYVKETIEALLGAGRYEDWAKDGFYSLITQFNDKWVGAHLSIAEVNFFLAQLAAKYDLEYKPARIFKPAQIVMEFTADWEIVD